MVETYVGDDGYETTATINNNNNNTNNKQHGLVQKIYVKPQIMIHDHTFSHLQTDGKLFFLLLMLAKLYFWRLVDFFFQFQSQNGARD